MAGEIYAYPFDPTGVAPTNLVENELQTLTTPNLDDYYFIIPKAAPYFRQSLKAYRHPSGEELVEGVDFNCGHLFYAASLQTGKPVYGSITFYDRTLSGSVRLEYQTVGGEWTLSEARILEILANKAINPRITTWEQVSGTPVQFPPIDHEYAVDDLVGMSEVVAELDQIEQAILQRNTDVLNQHIQDLNNPHNTTKAQVGLSNVQNYGMATLQEGIDGTALDRYMSPANVKAALDSALTGNYATSDELLYVVNELTASFNASTQALATIQ